MKWRFALAFVLVGVIVGGIVGFNQFRTSAIKGFFATMKRPAVAVSTIEVQPMAWQPGIDAIGTARAERGVDLAIELGGIVKKVLFAADQTVSQGQALLQIDDTVEQADLTAARALLNLKETTLGRTRALISRGVSTDAQLDLARADADSAGAQVAKLEALLEKKALTAPFVGVVGIPQVDAGQYVVPGMIYTTLQAFDRMRVDFTVPEQQLPFIHPGQSVTVKSEVAGISLVGEITAIEPKVDPNTRLVDVRAVVANTDAVLRSGQFLRVRIDLPPETGVIALPQTALAMTLYGDSVFVVQTKGQGKEAEASVEQVFVKSGRRSGGLVEIVSGIAPGDLVVTAGQNRLSGGARVVVDNTVNPLASVAKK